MKGRYFPKKAKNNLLKGLKDCVHKKECLNDLTGVMMPSQHISTTEYLL